MLFSLAQFGQSLYGVVYNFHDPNSRETIEVRVNTSVPNFYRGQPKAGTGYKMLSVPFVFSMSRFQGPAFRCDKIVVIVTLVRCIAVGLMFAILRILRKARGNGGYSMFRKTYLRVNLLSRIKTNLYQNYLYINLL